MASPLASTWVHATVPVDNPQGESGTGFLVSRMLDEQRGRVFLLTNKHVINRDPVKRPQVPSVMCHFNTIDTAGAPGTLQLTVPLRDTAGNPRFRAHTDPDTDVYAIDVTDVMSQHGTIQKKWVGYDMFADSAKRTELDITAGEEVVTIRYPLGLRQGNSNYPLIRQGLIAQASEHLSKTRYPMATVVSETARFGPSWWTAPLCRGRAAARLS